MNQEDKRKITLDYITPQDHPRDWGVVIAWILIVPIVLQLIVVILSMLHFSI